MTKFEAVVLFLLIFLLPSQLSRHLWLGSDGLSSVRIDYLSPTVYLTDLLALFLLIIRGLRLWSAGHFKPPHLSPPFILVFILMLINIIFSLSPVLSLFKFFQVGIYLLLLSSYSSQGVSAMSVFSVSFPLALIWSGLLALGQFYVSHSLGGIFNWLGERPLFLSSGLISRVDLGSFGPHLRAYSTFPHPNALAGFIVVGLLILLLLKLSRYSPPPVLFYTAFIVSAFSLITTFSFSAALVVVLNLFIYFLSFLPRLKPWGRFVLCLAFFLGGLYVSYLIKPVSFLDRLDLLRTSLVIIGWFAAFGTGFGAYLLGQGSPVSFFGSFYQPVHNVYLLLIAEIGLLPLLVFFTAVWRQILKLNSGSVPVVRLAFLDVLVLGLFDHYWLTSHANLILVVILLFLSQIRYAKRTGN